MDPANEKHLYNKKDPSSFSNPLEAVSTNIALDWDIDFDKQTISGSVEHTVRIVSDGASHVDFDSSKINITGDVLVNGAAGTYTTAPTDKVLGTKIIVNIPENLRKEGSIFSVKFNYYITTEASATQWLDASATKGQKHPYLFTQCQAIHARSLMPCQDSPGIKTQYTARVTAPTWCTVLMSAIAQETKEQVAGKNVFYWKQPTPTSAYLVALAAGRMESREISHRVRVWAEPEVVEAALFEFSETEEFVQAAEALTGCPYQWGRYDILCLPPSFPYGGMENPCLTFATPTLLAGDKSLADVIAHEIAHSWTGNLVTNHNWDHFWLNEGWTVWLERKIISKVRKNPEFGRLSSQVGWKHLVDDVQLHGEDNAMTALVWRLGDCEDPDDYYSSVPYEKGCNLLLYLEEVVGSELFSQFVASYIDKFKFSTVTSGEFRDHFTGFIEARAMIDASRLTSAAADTSAAEATPSGKKGGRNGKKNGGRGDKGGNGTPKEDKSKTAAAPQPTATMLAAEAVKRLDWQHLFYSPGLPTDVTSFSNSLSKAAEDLAQKWIIHAATYKTDSPPAGTGKDDMKDWPTQQKNVFLETLQNFSHKSLSPPNEVFPVPFLELMDRTYNLSASKNAEIMLRWQTLCLESEAAWILPSVVDFITSQGRMKFVRPLYRLLRSTVIGKQLAIDTFEANKNIYHPIARKMIATDLKRKADAEAEAIAEQLQAEQEILGGPVAMELDVESESPTKLPAAMDQTVIVDDEPAEGEPVPLSLLSTPSKGTTAKDCTPPPMSSPQDKFFTPDTLSAANTPVKEAAASTPAKSPAPAAAASPAPASPAPATSAAAASTTLAKSATPSATPAKAASPNPAPKAAAPQPEPVRESAPAAPAPAPAPAKSAEAKSEPAKKKANGGASEAVVTNNHWWPYLVLTALLGAAGFGFVRGGWYRRFFK